MYTKTDIYLGPRDLDDLKNSITNAYQINWNDHDEFKRRDMLSASWETAERVVQRLISEAYERGVNDGKSRSQP